MATISGSDVTMKTVGIAQLKARLSEYLKFVRKGKTFTQAEPVEVRRATRRLRDLVLPPPPSEPTDSLAVLLDGRRRR